MTCPYCQKELPENLEGDWCPFCGGGIPGKGAPGLPPPPVRQFQFNWQLFLWALLLPPSLTQLAALIFFVVTSQPNAGSVSGVVGLVGGAVGGITCGVMIAVCLGTSLPAKVVLSLFFSVIMIVVCLALCCFGCAVGYGGSHL